VSKLFLTNQAYFREEYAQESAVKYRAGVRIILHNRRKIVSVKKLSYKIYER